MFKQKNPFIISFICLTLVCSTCTKKPESPNNAILQPQIKEYSLAEISFIKSLVDSISESEIKENLIALERFGTRYSPSQGNLEAAHFIKKTLHSFGLEDVRIDEFSYYNEMIDLYELSRNVIASKRGVTTPDKVVIIGGHFDTICRRAADEKISELNKENPAPGTDDNGTGVAAVLSAARVLSPHVFDCTIRFIAFSAEEEGLYGSAHYAAQCARKNENIVGMINIDMIGHMDQKPEDMDIFSNLQSSWMLNRLAENAAIYAPGLLIYRIVNDTYDGSDHGPFWNNGYSAICFMEDYYPSSRIYHTPQDTIETVDLSFTLKSVKLAVGTLAELAGIHEKEEAPPSPKLKPEEIRSKHIDWEKDVGEKMLLTLSPRSAEVDVIDISFSNIHSKKSLFLEDIPSETYAVPHYHPVALSRSPQDMLAVVSMIRTRPTGGEEESGIVKIIDPKKGDIIKVLKVGKYPGEGCFNSNGTKFYLPYWGEKHIDVLETKSWSKIDSIPTAKAITKLVVCDNEQKAVALLPEDNSVFIIDIPKKTVEELMRNIPVPKDVILIDNQYALVCSYQSGKLFLIDIHQRETKRVIDGPLRPMHLLVSSNKKTIISIHQLSSTIGLYSVIHKSGEPFIQKEKRIDLDEVLNNGTFGSDDAIVYFISSSKFRLFGFNLKDNEVFWSMRTGDVRPRGGVKHILFFE